MQGDYVTAIKITTVGKWPPLHRYVRRTHTGACTATCTSQYCIQYTIAVLCMAYEIGNAKVRLCKSWSDHEIRARHLSFQRHTKNLHIILYRAKEYLGKAISHNHYASYTKQVTIS